MKQRLSLSVKIWISVSSVLLTLLVTATFLLVNIPFLYNTINSKFGGERFTLTGGNPGDYQYYTADYSSKKEVLNASNSLNEKICEEGFVLLKNEDNVLPLLTEKNVTVFGKNSVNLVIGGSGSNSGSSDNGDTVSIYDSLQNAGFNYNPLMKEFYEKDSTKRPIAPGMGSILTGFPVSETPIANYTAKVKDSYKNYSDAGIVVISRIGGEGFDLPRTMFWNGSDYTSWSGNQKIPGARNISDHYLQLDQNETDMLAEACNNFSKVIVVINSSSPMELGFLDDSTHYAYNQKIKGAIWIGNPGDSGINALGKILNGSVNPSGKTVDTYSRNFKNDPTWNNFGNNLKENGNRYNLNGSMKNAYFVEYAEGIYTGYRYYETRGKIEGETWYNNNVVYPFGYGLSYTTFEKTATEGENNSAILTKDGKLTFDVDVTNVGGYDGKDVVELYYSAPYTSGGVEKAHVVLGDYVKTNLLNKNGGTQKVTLELDVRDMASYDYNDKNGNDFYGYEVEQGQYDFYICNDAHGWNKNYIQKFSYTVPNGGFKYEKDDTTNTTIKNLFDDVSGHIDRYLSRQDFEGTWPKTVTDSDLSASAELINSLTYKVNDTATDKWYTENMPNQSSKTLTYDETEIKLYELFEKDYNDPLWDSLLNQLTVAQMSELCSKGNYRTIQLENILKPLTTDADGPMGFTVFMGDPAVYDTCFYASECVIGATYNKDLAYEMGKMIGNEGIIGNQKGDGRPYSGWYAPAMNLHRSQFGGRNFEYYSEDGYLTGKMASMVVKGAQEKGVYTYCKHFALNDQETNRDTTGLITWANEQSMRELYFEPFEMVVKDGKTTAMMSSFNRLGATWAGGNYALLTELLRDEWGFNGTVITDFNLKTYMNLDQMIRAGGDLNLSPGKDLSSVSSATEITAVRRATKNILYTVVNSNATNGLGEGIRFTYVKPYWEIALIAIDCVFVLGLSVWGFIVVKKWREKKDNDITDLSK